MYASSGFNKCLSSIYLWPDTGGIIIEDSHTSFPHCAFGLVGNIGDLCDCNGMGNIYCNWEMPEVLGISGRNNYLKLSKNHWRK